MRKDKTNKQTKIDQEENEESATFNKRETPLALLWA